MCSIEVSRPAKWRSCLIESAHLVLGRPVGLFQPGGAVDNACRTRLDGSDRRGWSMLQTKMETTRARYMLILVRMLMQCLRKSGFDRRHMAEAVLAMRDVMTREEEPSFVIKDPRYVKESKTILPCCISSMAYGWLGWG